MSGDLAELLFGPKAPIGKDERIKTIPGGGWFIYFQTFGRQAAPFDGSWKPGDFERVD
ncbi:MAG TPA: hypothetical protein VFH89_06240 [Sphingomicrobium sp.]|nr:hypothetical protein [Sphingomicrobium sp.]